MAVKETTPLLAAINVVESERKYTLCYYPQRPNDLLVPVYFTGIKFQGYTIDNQRQYKIYFECPDVEDKGEATYSLLTKVDVITPTSSNLSKEQYIKLLKKVILVVKERLWKDDRTYFEEWNDCCGTFHYRKVIPAVSDRLIPYVLNITAQDEACIDSYLNEMPRNMLSNNN
jgi:hypothetical protein